MGRRVLPRHRDEGLRGASRRGPAVLPAVSDLGAWPRVGARRQGGTGAPCRREPGRPRRRGVAPPVGHRRPRRSSYCGARARRCSRSRRLRSCSCGHTRKRSTSSARSGCSSRSVAIRGGGPRLRVCWPDWPVRSVSCWRCPQRSKRSRDGSERHPGIVSPGPQRSSRRSSGSRRFSCGSATSSPSTSKASFVGNGSTRCAAWGAPSATSSGRSASSTGCTRRLRSRSSCSSCSASDGCRPRTLRMPRSSS